MTNLDSESFYKWNQCVTSIVDKKNISKTPEFLIKAINILSPSDIALIVIYGEQIKPINIYDNASASLRMQNIDAYFEGSYLLDPFYRAGVNNIDEGLYHLKDVSPQGFLQSEYYNKYYKSSLIGDEVGYVIYLSDNFFAHISLVNLKGTTKFSKQDIETLKNATPIIKSSLINFWDHKENRSSQNLQFHSQFEEALNVFASSVLTKRELEIIHYFLHGHNSKSIAERLNISAHTVALHRKKSYAKLDIGSQAELFHLFFDSLYCYKIESKQDPLIAYLGMI